MEILLIILSILCAVIGIIGCVAPIIPGPVFGYGALWLAQWSGYCEFSTEFMIVMAILTLVVMVLDYFLPPLITSKMGGSKYASWGSFAGMLFGVFFTPVGMILGMLLGAFLGELVFAKKSEVHSLKAALGAFLGFLTGTGFKLILCCYILYKIVAVAFL